MNLILEVMNGSVFKRSFCGRQAVSANCRPLKPTTFSIVRQTPLPRLLFVFHSTMTCILSQLPELGYCRCRECVLFVVCLYCGNRHYDTHSERVLWVFMLSNPHPRRERRVRALCQKEKNDSSWEKNERSQNRSHLAYDLYYTPAYLLSRLCN